MELFKLMIFSTSLFLFGYGVLFETMLIYLFLTITYKTNINYNNTLDPMTIFVNLINIMMHLIVYQFDNFVKSINKTRYGSLAISTYNYLDSKVVQIKNLIFHWLVLIPIKFILGKTIGTLLDDNVIKAIKEIKQTKLNRNNIKQTPTIKRSLVSSKVKLETNADISNFLDRLLDENKKIN